MKMMEGRRRGWMRREEGGKEGGGRFEGKEIKGGKKGGGRLKHWGRREQRNGVGVQGELKPERTGKGNGGI